MALHRRRGAAPTSRPDSVTHLDPLPRHALRPAVRRAHGGDQPVADRERSRRGAPGARSASTRRRRGGHCPLRAVRPEDYQLDHRDGSTGCSAPTPRRLDRQLVDRIRRRRPGGRRSSCRQRAGGELGQPRSSAMRQAAPRRLAHRSRLPRIDLDIGVCVQPGHYPGEVALRVIEALTGKRRPHRPRPSSTPTISPSASRCAARRWKRRCRRRPSVQGVEEHPYPGPPHPRLAAHSTSPISASAPSQIIRLQNDPSLPERGTLVVRARAGTWPCLNPAARATFSSTRRRPTSRQGCRGSLPRQWAGFPEYRRAMLSAIPRQL